MPLPTSLHPWQRRERGELGRRPAQPELRPAWDRAVAAIAGYRHERGLPDNAPSALGPEPAGGPARAAWQKAHRAAERAAAEIGRPLA